MSKWVNPYEDVQQALRASLMQQLKRSNGVVERGAVEACFNDVSQPEKVDKLLARLFTVNAAGALEWKPDFSDADVLAKRVSGTKILNFDKLSALHRESRRLEHRTRFPNIAPSRKRSQLVSRHDYSASAVFGVDILARPPKDNSNKPGTNRNLHVGEENIVLELCGNFKDQALVNDGEFSARMVAGEAFTIPLLFTVKSAALHSCKVDSEQALIDGDLYAATGIIAQRLDQFAKDAIMDFTY